VFLENIEQSIKTLNLLKEIDLEISIDDFGDDPCGYFFVSIHDY